MPARATDILVRCANPTALDEIVQSFGAAVVGGPADYAMVEGCYVVRCFGNPGFIEFAITNQRYGTVVRRLEHIL